MKKTIAKKVLTLTSTILMTLLMVLGFNGTRVQADTNDTTTQTLSLLNTDLKKMLLPLIVRLIKFGLAMVLSLYKALISPFTT